MQRTVLFVLMAVLVLGAAGSATPAGTRPLKVGLVLDSGPADPYGSIALAGLRRAARELGVQALALTAGAKEGAEPTFAYFARKQYDLVLGLGFMEAGAVAEAARRFPRTAFAVVDAPWESLPGRPTNVRGTVYRVEQASYLAGYLAASMEMGRPGRHVVSAVGGYRIPTVEPIIAGFRAGALKADPRAVVLIDYANDFIDTAKCRRVALGQIARGSGVVFQVAGGCGLGALEAAKEKRVWGIGVDSDQSALGPHILTSVVKRMDVATFETVRSFRNDTFKPGRSAVFDLANGGVALGKISPKVPKAILAQVDRIRRRIATGQIGPIPTAAP